MSINTGTYGATPAVLDLSYQGAPTVSLIPGIGNTSKCEATLTPGAFANPGAANWFPWSFGTVSVPTNSVFFGKVTALRFTRMTGSSSDTYEVVT